MRGRFRARRIEIAISLAAAQPRAEAFAKHLPADQATGVPRDAIEEIIEPFLIQQGFIQRTPRGRLLTGHAFRHLGLAEPRRDPAQFGLFGEEDGN